MALLKDPDIALMRGIPTRVLEAISAAGTAQAHAFSALKPPGSPSEVHCQAVGTFTIFNGNVESSEDGGTTWSIFMAFDFVAIPILVMSLAAGSIYRFNVSNITKTVSPVVNATLA